MSLQPRSTGAVCSFYVLTARRRVGVSQQTDRIHEEDTSTLNRINPLNLNVRSVPEPINRFFVLSMFRWEGGKSPR